MDHFTLAIIAAAIGGFFAVIGKYITSWFSSKSKDTINLRQTLLKRINQLEERQAQMEKRQAKTDEKLQRWILRYWNLYRWSIQKYKQKEIDDIPPDFHDMSDEQLKNDLNNYSSKSRTIYE